MKRILVLGWIWIACAVYFLSLSGGAQAKRMVIALDPGHGGEENGAYYYGKKEKDINAAIAKAVKERLERYEDVEVVLTRDTDETVGLAERVRRVANADILISLHCNASASHRSEGASVYISTGEKNREMLSDLADSFLGETEAIGLSNAGTFARVTQMGGRRADGSFEDYYGVLRHAYNSGIPALLVEHCYMDHETDHTYVADDTGIEKLADADANAIAAYYGLKDVNGNTPKRKHAAIFKETTKAGLLDDHNAPLIRGIRLLSYDGKTPGVATYRVIMTEQSGIASMYLVYQNAEGNTATVSLTIGEMMQNGQFQAYAYIPEYLDISDYALIYIGAYDLAGLDAGYNLDGNEMIGFGKCDWLNRFVYNGEADLSVQSKGSLATAHAERIEYEITLRQYAVRTRQIRNQRYLPYR